MAGGAPAPAGKAAEWHLLLYCPHILLKSGLQVAAAPAGKTVEWHPASHVRIMLNKIGSISKV